MKNELHPCRFHEIASMKTKSMIIGMASAVFAASCLADEAADRAGPGMHDVIWDSPSDDSRGSFNDPHRKCFEPLYAETAVEIIDVHSYGRLMK